MQVSSKGFVCLFVLIFFFFFFISHLSFEKGLLQRDASKRFDMTSVQTHTFFEGMNWEEILRKEITPPFVPAVPGGDLSTLNFEDK